MKNRFVIVLLMLGIFLTACNGNGDATDDVSDETENNTTEDNHSTVDNQQENAEVEEQANQNEDEPQPESDNSEEVNEATDVEQVLLKAQDAMEGIGSMSIDIESDRQILDNGAEYQNYTATTGKVLLTEPFEFHQTLVVETDGAEPMEMEYYRVADKIYLSNPMSGEWAYLTVSDGEETIYMSDPADQFATIESLQDSFSIAEEGNEYVITFTGDSGEFKQILNDAVQVNDDAVSGRYFDNGLEGFDIEGTYEFRIDKETYYFNSIVLDYQSEIEAELSETTIDETMTINYGNFNEYKEIEIPEDVLNNAQPFGGQ